MLKWVVNVAIRQSYLQQSNSNDSVLTDRPLNFHGNFCIPNHSKSFSYNEITSLKRREHNQEDNIKSTPLTTIKSTSKFLYKLHNLKDLNNLALSTNYNPSYTLQNFKSNNSSNYLKTPKNNPSLYATTLPTFEAEYSPFNTMPGSILALREIRIVDSYFEKPRYLTNKITQTFETSDENSENNLTNKPLCSTPQNLPIQKNYNDDDESLNSSRMSDTTLDRMINAILESARREKRIPKFRYILNHSKILSPTYTPAEDPANDLNKKWNSKNGKDFDHKNRKSNICNEVKVKMQDNMRHDSKNNQTQDHLNQRKSFHLKRQNAIRCKRKLSLSYGGYILSNCTKIHHKKY